VLKTEPGDSAPRHYNRGLDLIAEGKIKEGIEELHKAARIDPDDAAALCEIGRIEIERDRLDSAVRFLEEALSRDPEHPGTLNNRGVAAFLSEQYQDAAEWFRSAVKADPELADAWFNLADSCEELGDTEGQKQAALRYRALCDDNNP